MSRHRLRPAACVLLTAIGLSSFGPATVANAQDSVEGFMRRVFGPPEQERHKSREPHRRNGEKSKSGTHPKSEAKAEPAPAPPPVAALPAPVSAAVPTPSPDPRPEPKADEGKKEDTSNPAPSAVEPKAAPTVDAAATDQPTPVPGQPNAVQPPPIEAQPPEDIPVPEKRPPEPPTETASPPDGAHPADTAVPSGKRPPVAGQAGVEPPKPGDAPNSTEKLKSREPTIDPATSVVAAAAIEDAEECEAELKKRGVMFEVKESISEGECGVLRPVSFERSSAGVKVSPGTQMLCRAALALDTWLADSVVPAAKANFPDRKLTEFRQASTYVCRPRASENGISEHARGSAIDIGAFVFDKGDDIGVAAQTAGSPEAKFQDAVRASACGPFKTVLGPGTDPDHATHFHLDIAARRNGSTYCK